MNKIPKISIITVVRDGEKYIGETIRSIANQTYPNIEYIIIDGKSKDRTTEIIKNNEKNISFWLSESDKGIYDAMNKGVSASTGDWILFVNSDDYLVNPDTIYQCTPYLRGAESLIVYGQILFINPSGNEKLIGTEWKYIKEKFRQVGMVIPHQATFHSKKLFEMVKFDASYKLLGDYNLLLSYLNKHDAQFIPLPVSKMRAGGISDNANVFTFLKEATRSQKSNGIINNQYSWIWISNTIFSIFYYYFKLAFGSEIKIRLRTWLRNVMK